ncbi:uncharacterized protein LOC107263263 [Cephus cinctus]|uniref:Uncharacterized protein LOC107263263 n=1 Tax=Cephus cinctus TaxID=211228 RepID=A0AAJ7BGX0_CEPCN|nr:uncharacterized protein LOC107263263 [Cephus cinctus]XP_015585754.1 uncharacterized protein LOC107263263 [Cephus cinctus]
MKRIGRRDWLSLVLLILVLVEIDAQKQKRQIYREQVLPALGGKIPDEAFRSDRLALNRLNKEGITTPDGVVLIGREVQKHPQKERSMPELLKVYLTPDGRYVPPEGRYHYSHPKAVDTTYVIRSPIGRGGSHKSGNDQSSYKPRGFSKSYSYTRQQQYPGSSALRKPGIYKPIIAPFIIPTRELLVQPFYPIWNTDFGWNDAVYDSFDEFFINNLALFNSHQIITDYDEFFNQFHARQLRHIRTEHDDKSSHPSTNNLEVNVKPPVTTLEPPILSKNFRSKNVSKVSGYTDLTKIPETSFVCRGRTGTFADVQTKCQVFHECTGFSKSSSLCPVGTAYSESKKRCEWWNNVTCQL